MKPQGPLVCPSAQPEMPGAVIHGVVDAATGQIRHLEAPMPVTEELLASTAPLLPSEVLRFSAPCATHGCGHYTGSACSLVERLVTIVPLAGSATLPRCMIRANCRWFAEQGRAACMHCDDIVTDAYQRNERMTEVAKPPARV